MKKKICILSCMAACLVVCLCISYMRPKHYESKFVVARESEEPATEERAVMLHHTTSYDLGVVRTRNAVDQEGYKVILGSDAFLYSLLDCEVKTLDGSYAGTIGEYLMTKKSLLARIREAILPAKEPICIEDSSIAWYSQDEVEAMGALRKMIEGRMDYETRFVTVTCTADDPLMATMLARSAEERLLATIDAYEMAKMERQLAQIAARLAEAEAAYAESKAVRSDDVQLKGEVVEAFRRQKMVFEAQMMHQAAFVTLSEPTVSYKPAGGRRWMMPLLLTLLLGAAMVGWDKRRVILAYIQG